MKSRSSGGAVYVAASKPSRWLTLAPSIVALVATLASAFLGYVAVKDASNDRTSQGVSDFVRQQRQAAYLKLFTDVAASTDATSHYLTDASVEGLSFSDEATFYASDNAFYASSMTLYNTLLTDEETIKLVGSDAVIDAAHRYIYWSFANTVSTRDLVAANWKDNHPDAAVVNAKTSDELLAESNDSIRQLAKAADEFTAAAREEIIGDR